MNTFLRLALVVAAALSSSPLLARDYFVNNSTGNDAFSGLQETAETQYAGPLRTIQRALKKVQPGDRIILAKTDEPYREMLSLSGPNHRSDGVNPLVILGNGAVLDGTRPIDPRSWKFVADSVYRYEPRRKGPQMLFLDGTPAKRMAGAIGAGVIPADSAPLVDRLSLDALAWDRDWQFNYFRTEEHRLPETYPLSQAVLDVGITLHHARGVRIEDLVIQGFRVDGVQFADGTNECELSGCTLRGNGRSGVAVVNSSRAVISNCLIGNNGEAQVLASDYSVTILRGNDILEDGAPAIVKTGMAEVVVEEAGGE